MINVVVDSFVAVLVFQCVFCCEYGNVTLQPTQRQLCEYRMKHPIPGLTTTAGRPVDLREIVTINSDLIANEYLLDSMMHFTHERIPARVVHAKGTAAYGYFEVTHDVSKYTKADVFNGIRKRTPVLGRFSTAAQGSGGPDVTRELKGLGIKFYTKEGNLDLLCLQTPVYLYTDPLYFQSQIHALTRNPRTDIFDRTAQWDFVTNRPQSLHAILYTQSDYGIPASYRNMDVFPIHTYELNNAEGDRHFVRFNFRTNQGIRSLKPGQVLRAAASLDYYNRDLYNAIHRKQFPSWTLEMDVMSFEDVKHLDYNPFDVTRLWKNGTYHTEKIGRLVFNRKPKNSFATAEVSAFNPGSLVPGIPGPVDTLFKARKLFYRDTQNYRVGINHNNAEVNKPLYAKTYTRDGVLPVKDNMKDAPNYYPNSFNGPEPIVDETLPSQRVKIVENNVVDLQPAADFYNLVLTDAHKQRLATVLGQGLAGVTHDVQKNAIILLTRTDKDLGRRVRDAIRVAIDSDQQSDIGYTLA